MKLRHEPLPGLLEIELTVHGDERGSFTETHNRDVLAALGVDTTFVQDNESWSADAGVVRGLHLQLGAAAQGKLIRVLRGRIFDVAVDLRPDSSTYLRHATVELAGEDPMMFWIPAGFAHGFCTLEPDTIVAYKVDAPYEPTSERTIAFDDPSLAIPWPVTREAAQLSAKDAAAGPFAELRAEVER
ncbi:MAG: dTDP-4-dehydrorhamnose 3,5-epimerase [Actinomycetota bacterium]